MRALFTLSAIVIPALVCAAPPTSQPSPEAAIRPETGTTRPGPPPGGIRLLEGYRHEKIQGIDSLPGRIWKEGGLEISYDISLFRPEEAKGVAPSVDERSKWAIRQLVSGRVVDIDTRKDGLLVVRFSDATFYAKVTGEKDLAEFLAIVLTYPLPAEPR